MLEIRRTAISPYPQLAGAGKEFHTVWVAMATWSALMAVLCAGSGVRHDYIEYLSQWRAILAGADPWATNNAYGPLHNLLAVLLPLGLLAPKFLMAAALLLANFLFVRELLKLERTAVIVYGYLLAVPANFLIIIMAFAYGLNDALVAAFVTLAVIARYRDRMLLAGALLGLAILLKYYPIFLVPFFALEKNRIRADLVVAALVVTSIGLVVTVYLWKGAFLAPLYFAAERPPKILSILSALQSDPVLVGGHNILKFLVRTNSAFVVAIACLGILVAWTMRLHWIEASVLGLLAILLTYKVGHQQFYIPWLFLVAALPLAERASARRLLVLCLPFVIFLSVFQLCYFFANGSAPFDVVRKYVGFVAFIMGVATTAAYFFTFRRDQLISR